MKRTLKKLGFLFFAGVLMLSGCSNSKEKNLEKAKKEYEKVQEEVVVDDNDPINRKIDFAALNKPILIYTHGSIFQTQQSTTRSCSPPMMTAITCEERSIKKTTKQDRSIPNVTIRKTSAIQSHLSMATLYLRKIQNGIPCSQTFTNMRIQRFSNLNLIFISIRQLRRSNTKSFPPSPLMTAICSMKTTQIRKRSRTIMMNL